MERAMGIEPTSEAWEASILPLYDARSEAIVPAKWAAGKRPAGSDWMTAKSRRRGGRGTGLRTFYALAVPASALVIAQQRCAGFLTLAECSISVKRCDFGGTRATSQNAHAERLHWPTRLLR
jgi:hypothetical protein